VWAQFDPIRGREYYSAKQEQAETLARFCIRYRADIVPEMRILFGGQFYDIEDVINVRGLNVELELMTREGLTNG
jgi:SPP1 family predicted phage head-tail adaptor